MANIQIPNLPAVLSVNGPEMFEIVQNGTSYRATAYQVAGLTALLQNQIGNGALTLNPPTTITAATYSQLITDASLIFNGTATQTVTMLTPSLYPGRMLFVKNPGGQTVNSASPNIVPVGSTTAGTALLVNTAGKWAILQSDGTNWNTLASN